MFSFGHTSALNFTYCNKGRLAAV